MAALQVSNRTTIFGFGRVCPTEENWDLRVKAPRHDPLALREQYHTHVHSMRCVCIWARHSGHSPKPRLCPKRDMVRASTRFTSAGRFGNPQAKVTVMPSARTQCPHCAGQLVVALDQVLCSAHADFLQCARCGHLWHVPKGEEGPASQALLGKKLRRAS